MSTRRIWLPVLAMGLLQCSSVALAEETLRADTPQLDTRPVPKRVSLSGKVSVQTEHHAPPITAVAPAVVHKPVVAVRKPQSVIPAKVAAVAPAKPVLTASANSFAGVPMQGMLERNQDMLHGFNRRFNHYNPYNPYAMRVQQQQPRPKSTNPDDAPYRWGQCGTGGYYDTTGTYKGPMVWGDKLASFGGRFFDGTPVPKGEVKINSMGHIWWQNQLSTSFIKHEDARRQGLNE
jgi:hypothetical protein